MCKIAIFAAFGVVFLLTVVRGTVETTCKEAADIDKLVDYHFCVDELIRHHDSSKPDTWSLAHITTLLGASSAVDAFFGIKALLAKPDTNDKVRGALERCQKLYDRVVVSFLIAHEDINIGNYTAGIEKLKEAMPLSQTCEDTFAKCGIHSPFTKQSQDLVKLAIKGIAITNLIK